MKQVRVNSLQGLIYKEGQAGVTRASVSIEFDNSDPKISPMGYQDEKTIVIQRIITVERNNKYTINGKIATQTAVRNLFNSVQLNVNNPHFLIMQGHITKVLNMNAKQILGLVEEAAGTRQYEQNKIQAERQIAKKDEKVKSINDNLDNKITPMIKKLQDQRADYHKYTQASTSIDSLKRYMAAFNFYTAVEKVAELQDQQQTLQTEIQQMEENLVEKNTKHKELDEEIRKIQKEKDAEKSGGLDSLIEEEGAIRKEITSLKSSLKNHKKEQENWINEVEDLTTELQTMKSQHDKNKEEYNNLQIQKTETEENINKQQKLVEESTDRLMAVRSGVASADGTTGTLEEQIQDATDLLMETTQAVDTNKAKMKQFTKTKNDISKELSGMKSDDVRLKEEIQNAETKMNQIQNAIEKLDFNSQEYEEMRQQFGDKQRELADLKRQLQKRSRIAYRIELGFQNPRGVFGTVAKLFKVPDPTYMAALEVGGGGKLHNIVVDNVNTGKLLIEDRRMKRRITLIPLDKINARRIPEEALHQLRSVGDVHYALDLIEYSPEMRTAIEYCFGNVMICRDMTTARRVLQESDRVSRKFRMPRPVAVTFEGDVCRGGGVFEGGASKGKNDGQFLKEVGEYVSIQESINILMPEIQKLQRTLESQQSASNNCNELTHTLEITSRDLERLKDEHSRTESAKMQSKLDDAEKDLNEVQVALKSALEEKDKVTNQLKQLKEDQKNAGARIERQTKEMETLVAKAKKDLTKLQKLMTTIESRMCELGDDEKASKETAGESQKRIKQIKKQLATSQEKSAEEEEKLEEILKAHEEIKEQLQKMRESLAVRDGEIRKIMGLMNKIQKEIDEGELAKKKTAKKVDRIKSNENDSQDTANALVAAHPWIHTEKQFFNKPGTDYDFTERDPKTINAELDELIEVKEQLSGKINHQVVALLDRAEQEYDNLVKKKKQIGADKIQIEKTIAELDKKKNEKLERSWHNVNRDFGSIFSTLLPGTKAALSPPAGGTVLDGLEVKVAFGEVWKESLTELSGGQRSLLALSLVLALLLFNPAPMYILDEVDAALDLNHTQNIGRMLKKHFKRSQFIVVSLKMGMFNNANVLFKTRFVDGVSTVARLVNKVQPSEFADENTLNPFAAKDRDATGMVSSAGGVRQVGALDEDIELEKAEYPSKAETENLIHPETRAVRTRKNKRKKVSRAKKVHSDEESSDFDDEDSDYV
eukprot:TRINITY_DN6455_c0_g1_i1.p1 TRINITY_DN6455_c0_g1~~TRINITY_DN6455_c0_g1_i1.p1  ORF type:complete len:1221 (+),score=493.95 TRINITY_DN6455_c0_g1_i1:2-3664(+)